MRIKLANLISIYKRYLIPLGTLFIVMVVLGGVVYFSFWHALLAIFVGSLLGISIHIGNTLMLRAALKNEFATTKASSIVGYVVVLIFVCTGLLLLMGKLGVGTLLCAGIALIVQLFTASLVSVCKSLKVKDPERPKVYEQPKRVVCTKAEAAEEASAVRKKFGITVSSCDAEDNGNSNSNENENGDCEGNSNNR